jgi:hypothetical protein
MRGRSGGGGGDCGRSEVVDCRPRPFVNGSVSRCRRATPGCGDGRSGLRRGPRAGMPRGPDRRRPPAFARLTACASPACALHAGNRSRAGVWYIFRPVRPIKRRRASRKHVPDPLASGEMLSQSVNGYARGRDGLGGGLLAGRLASGAGTGPPLGVCCRSWPAVIRRHSPWCFRRWRPWARRDEVEPAGADPPQHAAHRYA